MKGKQDKHLDFVGRFESPVDASVALEGRLVRRQKGLRLETTPTFSSPLSTAALSGSRSLASPDTEWDVLHGRTSDGLCSLLNTEPRQDSSTDFGEYSVDWHTYSVDSVLGDVHLSGVEEPCITGARLEFEQLRPWLRQSLRISKSEQETSIAAPRLEPAFVDFSAYPSQIRYQLVAESLLCVNHERGAIFQKTVVVKLGCVAPISYLEFREIEVRVQDFLSILMGIPISASKIQLTFGEETGYLFRRRI